MLPRQPLAARSIVLLLGEPDPPFHLSGVEGEELMFFDGLKRTCVRFKRSSKAKGLRCESFEPASKVGRHPACPGQGLKGGGRSQWAIRGSKRCKRAGKK